MSGFRYYNQSTPKYINGEPGRHLIAKHIIAVAASNGAGYDHIMEVKTNTVEGYRVDIVLWNPETEDRIAVNLDGGYHDANNRQIAKTKARDYILTEYYHRQNTRYLVFKVEDIYSELDVSSICRKLGIDYSRTRTSARQ